MYSLPKYVFISTVLLMLATSCSKEICSNSDDKSVIEGKIGTDLNELIINEEQVKFSGAVLVASEGAVLLNKSYAYNKTNSDCEVRHGDSYWIASLSKSFCAAAVLLLHERGEIDLQASISSYLNGVPSDKMEITIHQLLSHSSGMGDSYGTDGISDQQEALKALLETEMVSKPGDSYSYSNAGYQLLAILIEVLSGTRYENFITDEIITPLGLNNTGHTGDQQYGNVLSVTERGKGSKRRASGNPQLWKSNYGYKGSTGILSSVNDLLTWNQALHENSLLRPENSKLLFEAHLSKGDGIFYGYGWNVFDSDEGQVIVHSGDDDFIGHNATLRFYPESNKLIVVLSDAGYYKGDPVARVMAKRIIPELFN